MFDEIEIRVRVICNDSVLPDHNSTEERARYMSRMSELHAVLTSVRPEDMHIVQPLLARYGVKKYTDLFADQQAPFLEELAACLKGDAPHPADAVRVID